ncbi:hypothetical protein Clacol_001971 [Clathrus columnatus]|uniref:Uncharacterized protein n=1 Tax=Clathrus columnatus TaxID=1419009 RepID=A0AAV5A408_9AGAM|nr:hypothetical protein Clacol_001971 [Clathrus columnatus]
MTNGGGTSEEERCQKLSSQLGIKREQSLSPSKLDTFQLIQAHTPLCELPRRLEKSEEEKRPHYRDPVLVLGGIKDNVRKIAEGQKVDFSKIQFGSIMVFHDPRNWSLDIQVMLDILQSKTRSPGGPRGKPIKPVELIFCNPDLLWRGSFQTPRLGQGAFIAGFQAIYHSLTGEYYPCIQYGKPLSSTFEYAEAHLMRHLNVRFPHITSLPKMYMIGDISGANAANWSSVLVHTGVYDPETGPPAHSPTHQAANVEEAVKLVLEQEGYLT